MDGTRRNSHIQVLEAVVHLAPSGPKCMTAETLVRQQWTATETASVLHLVANLLA